MVKLAIIGAAMLAVPAAAEAPAPTFSDAIAICRLHMIETLRGGDGSKTVAAIAALPDTARPLVALVCAGYDQGQVDLITVMRGQPDKAAAI